MDNMKNDGYAMDDLVHQLFGQFMDDENDKQEDVILEEGKMYILSNI